MATATTWSGPLRKGKRAAATFSARASSSAKVKDSPVRGICKAVRCGNFSAERLKTSVSHRTPFWCGTLAMWSPSKTSVKLYLQVSAWLWTISAAQMYRLQATTASKKKSTKTVATTIDVNTCPHALANLDAQVLKHDCILTSNMKVVRSRSYRTHRAIEIMLRSGSADVLRDAMGSPPNILEC